MSETVKSAIVSACETYRYALTRRWGDNKRVARFIMLNPSTADAEIDDPTIRRCIGFAKREGCDALTVVNMFALRATDPVALISCPDPVGPLNDVYLSQVIRRAVQEDTPLIAAWGATADCVGLRHHIKRMERTLRDNMADLSVTCLGATQAGHPRHPLYVKADQPLAPYPWKMERPQCSEL